MKIHTNPFKKSRTLILLQTHGGVDAALKRHWPWLLKSGCDILVTSPEDDPSIFEGPLLGKVIARMPGDYYRLQERTLMLFETLLRERPDYDDVMLLPYDCIFLHPIKPKNGAGLESRLDKSEEAFIAPFNSTPPWWFDWETLGEFITAARTHPIDFERGIMDRWFAALCHVHNIPHHQTRLIGYGRNNVSDDWPVVEESIRAGFPLVHGIKTETELKHVLAIAKLA